MGQSRTLRKIREQLEQGYQVPLSTRLITSVALSGRDDALRDIWMERADSGKIMGHKAHPLVEQVPASLKDPGTKLSKRVEDESQLSRSQDQQWSDEYRMGMLHKAVVITDVENRLKATASEGLFGNKNWSDLKVGEVRQHCPGPRDVNPQHRVKAEIGRDG